ncbi:MAG: hypothetical protein V1928_02950 [Parcubacteria group bacterium]
MSKRLKQSLAKLKTKARLALDSPALVGIADSANSPNAAYERGKVPAYELAYLVTGNAKQAKKLGLEMAQACRFLAMIKRDYGKEAFKQAVLPVVSNRPQTPDRK